MNTEGELETALHSQESGPVCLDPCLGSIVGIQFRDYAPGILLGGYFRDEELSRGGFIGKPIHQQLQHIHNIQGAVGANSTIVRPISVDDAWSTG